MITKREKSDLILKKIGRKQGASSLVVSELLEQLMSVWGGSQQFATAFHTEFKEAHAGGIVRARMLSDVFRLFQAHTASQKGPTNMIESMTDAELREAVCDLLGTENGDTRTDNSP